MISKKALLLTLSFKKEREKNASRRRTSNAKRRSVSARKISEESRGRSCSVLYSLCRTKLMVTMKRQRKVLPLRCRLRLLQQLLTNQWKKTRKKMVTDRNESVAGHKKRKLLQPRPLTVVDLEAAAPHPIPISPETKDVILKRRRATIDVREVLLPKTVVQAREIQGDEEIVLALLLHLVHHLLSIDFSSLINYKFQFKKNEKINHEASFGSNFDSLPLIGQGLLR